MRDVDDLLRALDSPDPPGRAPAWPTPSRWPRRALAGGLALAALSLLVLLVRPPSPSLRGQDPEAVQLDLRMVVERGGVAVRLSPKVPPRTGERVLFRVQSDRSVRAHLWVDGPSGRQDIAQPEVESTPRDVGDGSGLIGYRFDGPGRYVFHLEPDSGSCLGACPSLAVEVR